MDLGGKIVVVTGAARGIGLEFARGLGAAGAQNVAADIADCSATFLLWLPVWRQGSAVQPRGLRRLASQVSAA